MQQRLKTATAHIEVRTTGPIVIDGGSLALTPNDLRRPQKGNDSGRHALVGVLRASAAQAHDGFPQRSCRGGYSCWRGASVLFQ